MRLLLPPKAPARYILAALFSLLGPTGLARAQARVAAPLHVVQPPAGLSSSAQTPFLPANGAACRSIAEIQFMQRAGTFKPNPQIGLCMSAPGTEAAQASRLQSLVRPIAARQLTVEPAATAVDVPNPAGGFSGFQVAPSYLATPTPLSYTTTLFTLSADFRKTGFKDVLTIDSTASLRFLANNGDGTFGKPVSSDLSTPGSYFTGFAAALVYDFDKDGYPDLIVRDAATSSLVFIRNKHDGTFAQTKSIALPATFTTGAILLGDVNGDGNADLIAFSTAYDYAALATTMSIFVYPGTGQGDFNSTPIQTDYSFAGAQVIVPNGGAVLDKNAGRPALYFEALVLNAHGIDGSTVFALPLNGDGTFNQTPYTQQDFPTANIYVNTFSGGLSLADLNRDGVPDLTMSFKDGKIYTALGQSDGTFPNVVVASPGFTVVPQAWVIADIDGDGIPDFVNKDIVSIEVLPGLGNGTFGNAPVTYASVSSDSGGFENSPGSNLVVDDFDGDRVADLVYVDGSQYGFNRAYMLHGYGDGTFFAAPTLPANTQLGYDAGHLYSQGVFDTNGDGFADIVAIDTAGSGPYAYRTALSDGKGGFTLIKALDAKIGTYGLGYVLATADLNGDGRKDLVVDAFTTTASGSYVHSLAIAVSNGDGTFKTPTVLDTGATVLSVSPSSVAVGDIDGDGVADIVAVTSGGYYDAPAILTFLGKADGTYQPAAVQAYGNTYAFAGIALADFNGDGKLDLFVSDDGTPGSALPQSTILFGKGSGLFDTSAPATVTTGLNLRSVQIGDLNGDGKPDLALFSGGVQSGYTVSSVNRGLLIYLNNGDGTFTTGNLYMNGLLPGSSLLADVNGDGKLDVISTVSLPSDLPAGNYTGGQLLMGGGDGTFGAPTKLSLEPGITFMGAGDLDGDGTTDLVTWSYYVGTTSVIRNLSGSTLTLSADAKSIVAGGAVTLTAQVLPEVAHRPVPTGTVTFTANGVVLGKATLLAGLATLQVTTLPAGTDTIHASYSGDTAFSTNTNSGTVAVTVTAAPVAQPDFILSAPTTSLALSPGGSGSISFVLSANSTFSGNVTFTATGLPEGMSVSFAPLTATLTPNGNVTGAVFISTTATRNARATAAAWIFAMPFCGMLLAMRNRRQRLPALMAGLLLLASLGGIAALSGCSAGPVVTASSGDYVIVVKATPSVSGASAKAFNVVVHVN